MRTNDTLRIRAELALYIPCNLVGTMLACFAAFAILAVTAQLRSSNLAYRRGAARLIANGLPLLITSRRKTVRKDNQWFLPGFVTAERTAILSSNSNLERGHSVSAKVADVLWKMLVHAGVKRCYGIVGDALNPVIDALPRNGKIDFIHVRHEEYGVFAAVAEV